MHPLADQRFQQGIRSRHNHIIYRLDLMKDNVFQKKISFKEGHVDVTSGTGMHRTFRCEIPDGSLWSELEDPTVELRPYRGLKYIDGTEVLIPLGVFGIDEQSINLGPTGIINIRNAPDRWARIISAKFTKPRKALVSLTNIGEARFEIQRLMEEASPHSAVIMTATSQVHTGPIVFERERTDAIQKCADSIGAEAFFDTNGDIVIRDQPTLNDDVAWEVDRGPMGVLISGTRTRSKKDLFNVVVVEPGDISGTTAPFSPVVVADTNPTSPTRISRIGERPFFFRTPIPRTQQAALTAGDALLQKLKRPNAQVSARAWVNPGLFEGDVILLRSAGVEERHLAVSFPVPMTREGTQDIECQSDQIPEGA